MENLDYDVDKAFATIEQELTASMMRNLERHKAEETKEGYNWTAWQAEQLKALRQYQQRNKDKYTKQFAHINAQIDEIINQSRKDGQLDQERDVLEAIRSGKLQDKPPVNNIEGKFFKTNDRKINALIKATKDDFKKGEVAMLRQANDQYRKIIFNAQMYAASGAGTYEQAVDMATRDFLKRGITSIEYKNGSRHTMSEYSRMCIRTASKRAYLTGEGEYRKERGLHLVRINLRNGACPLCAKWIGKIIIDDVWSGGSRADGDYPLMSDAVAAGLYHPNCKDIHSTYYGEDDDFLPISPEEKREILEKLVNDYNAEQKMSYAKKQEEKYGRLAEYSLDEENKRVYEARAQEWEKLKRERFDLVNFKTGGIEVSKYVENEKLSRDLQSRKEKEFGLENSKESINSLYSEAAEWEKLLTDDEVKYIKKYTHNPGDYKPNRFFERINKMLRKEIPYDEKLQHCADIISSGIRKFKVKNNIICYRRADADYTKGYDIGEPFCMGQFISTSIEKKCTIKGDFLYKIYVHKGQNGALIENISDYKSQKEFLIDKDVLCRVISRKGNIVTMEVISYD